MATPVRRRPRPPRLRHQRGGYTSGSRVVMAMGALFTIKAVHGSGLETSTCAPHGLWQVSLGSVVDRMHAWGFDTIRLPLCQSVDSKVRRRTDRLHPGPRSTRQERARIIYAVVAAARPWGCGSSWTKTAPTTTAIRRSGTPTNTLRAPGSSTGSCWRTATETIRPSSAPICTTSRPGRCWGCGVPALDWSAAAVRRQCRPGREPAPRCIIVEGVENQGGSAGSTGGAAAWLMSRTIRQPRLGRSTGVLGPRLPVLGIRAKMVLRAELPGEPAAVWNANFGYLQRSGTATVLIGEFGTLLETRSDQLVADALSPTSDRYARIRLSSYNPTAVTPEASSRTTGPHPRPRNSTLCTVAGRIGRRPRPARPCPCPHPRTAPTAPHHTLTNTDTVVSVWCRSCLRRTLESSWAQGYRAAHADRSRRQ